MPHTGKFDRKVRQANTLGNTWYGLRRMLQDVSTHVHLHCILVKPARPAREPGNDRIPVALVREEQVARAHLQVQRDEHRDEHVAHGVRVAHGRGGHAGRRAGPLQHVDRVVDLSERDFSIPINQKMNASTGNELTTNTQAKAEMDPVQLRATRA